MQFSAQLLDAGLRDFVTEYRFDLTRRWRFDFAWPGIKVAVELEGGVYSRGRHSRGAGFVADCDKYNAATLAGWNVYRYTAQHLNSGTAIEITRLALTARAVEIMGRGEGE
jgi:hypothetical protein